MSTKYIYISYRIVVDAEDQKLCGREECPSYRRGPPGARPTCGAFRSQLNGDPAKRCDECLASKEL